MHPSTRNRAGGCGRSFHWSLWNEGPAVTVAVEGDGDDGDDADDGDDDDGDGG